MKGRNGKKRKKMQEEKYKWKRSGEKNYRNTTAFKFPLVNQWVSEFVFLMRSFDFYCERRRKKRKLWEKIPQYFFFTFLVSEFVCYFHHLTLLRKNKKKKAGITCKNITIFIDLQFHESTR